MENQKKEKEKPRCPKCNSSFGYFRIKDKEFVCRSCGHIEEIEEDKA